MDGQLTCPGADQPGRTPDAHPVHADGCCARFILMSDERRAEIGLRRPAPRPPRAAARRYTVETISVKQLAALVAELQYQATAHPDAELPPRVAWVELAEDDDPAEVAGLIGLADPYNLAVGTRGPARATPTDSPA